MSMPARPTPRWFVAVYRTALRAAPEAFRRRYGDEAMDVAARRVRGRPRGSRPLAGLRELVDLAATIYREQRVQGRFRTGGGMILIEAVLQDVRYGLRGLRLSPGFTAVAVLTLGLGIGANTAIFSLVDALILRPLPVDQPGNIAVLFSTWKDAGTKTTFSYPDFLEIREETSRIFTGASAIQPSQDGLSLDGKSQPMWTCYVSGNFFALLGVKAALGRPILPSEGAVVGADPVLVISDSYWKSRFNSDPSVIGRKASVNGQPVTIIGVAPQGFHGISNWLDTQGYMPLAMSSTFNDAPINVLTDARNSSFAVIARLKTGVSLQQAQPALQVVAERLPEQNRGQRSIRAAYLGPASLAIAPTNPGVLTLASSLFLTLAGAVLVLACLNIANLFLARAAARQHEVAMRAALGATRGRLIRQLLTESLLLATLGCFGGIVLGILAARSMGSISMRTVLPTVLDFHFDWRVFAYALAAAAFTGVIVGIIPALRAARGNLNEVLHEGGRTFTAGRQRLRGALVVAQVASSLMLLIVAALFVRSLQHAQHSDLGFDPSHVLNATVDAHEAGYDDNQTREFQKNLLERARALPGVQSASLARSVPMGYSGDDTPLASIDGYPAAPGQKVPRAGINRVSPGYFRTMRIPLLQGRDIRDSDSQNSQRVAIVNQAFVDRYWHAQNATGWRFSTTGDPTHPIEVVGVVKNSREQDMFTKDEPFIYVPLAQDSDPIATIQLRTLSSPEALAPEVRGVIHALEPAMPVFDVQPMTLALEGANGFLLFEFGAAVASALGFIGLTLAVVGVYGVTSYSGSQRTHEIGVRMAFGAQPGQILKMVLGHGFVIVGMGVCVGILAAGALARLVSSFLFDVAALDPLTYISASLLLAFVALAASYIPARRAMRVDPMVALRYE
jgi:macrolide transport system ATP-binding/permease protein